MTTENGKTEIPELAGNWTTGYLGLKIREKGPKEVARECEITPQELGKIVSKYKMEVPPKTSGVQSVSLRFSGESLEYFKIWIVNIALTVLTLGIYSAWAKVRKNQYLYQSTSFQNIPFEYLAEPMNILKGRLIIFGAFVVYTLAISYLPESEIFFVLLFGGVFPWVVIRALSFRMRHTSYRNIRFQFKAAYKEAFIIYVGLTLLIAFTLGLIYPYFMYRQKKFVTDHSGYGKTPFVFLGSFKEVYLLLLKGSLYLFCLLMGGYILMIAALISSLENPSYIPSWFFNVVLVFLTAGIIIGLILIVVYLDVVVKNYFWNHTWLDKIRFKSTLEVSKMFWLYVTNILGILLSAGLLIPWATIRSARYRLENLHLITADPSQEFFSDEMKDVDATGEEFVDFYDFDFGL